MTCHVSNTVVVIFDDGNSNDMPCKQHRCSYLMTETVMTYHVSNTVVVI